MDRTSDTNAASSEATATPPHTEVTTEQLERMVGGLLSFTFKLVAVKTVSWAHDD